MNQLPNSNDPHASESFERRLRALQPRSPELDWDHIVPAVTNRATVEQTPLAPTTTSSGFTLWQMTSAVFASLIIGAILGGGVIYWSSTERNSSPNLSPTSPALAQRTREPTSDTNMSQAASVVESSVIQRNFNMPLDIHNADWLSQEVLSVRSLTAIRQRSRLTSINQAASRSTDRGSTNSLTDQPIVNVSPDTQSTNEKSPPILNQQQLLRKYLDESPNIY